MKRKAKVSIPKGLKDGQAIGALNGWVVEGDARMLLHGSEMLKALKALVGDDGDLFASKNIEAARAAIAKAEGR